MIAFTAVVFLLVGLLVGGALGRRGRRVVVRFVDLRADRTKALFCIHEYSLRAPCQSCANLQSAARRWGPR